MSWEDDSITKHKCPCGLGEYTVTLRSDDWNRHEERWTMALHPPFDYSFRWVKKDTE